MRSDHAAHARAHRTSDPRLAVARSSANQLEVRCVEFGIADAFNRVPAGCRNSGDMDCVSFLAQERFHRSKVFDRTSASWRVDRSVHQMTSRSDEARRRRQSRPTRPCPRVSVDRIPHHQSRHRDSRTHGESRGCGYARIGPRSGSPFAAPRSAGAFGRSPNTRTKEARPDQISSPRARPRP